MRANSRSVREGRREGGIDAGYRPSKRGVQQASYADGDEAAKCRLLAYFCKRGDRVTNAGRSGRVNTRRPAAFMPFRFAADSGSANGASRSSGRINKKDGGRVFRPGHRAKGDGACQDKARKSRRRSSRSAPVSRRSTCACRGAPDPAPLWMVLDSTPEGRGADWYPKLDYDA